MSISALDAGEDYSALTEPVDEKVKSLQKKMDVIDSQLEVLKGEEDSLAQDLDYAFTLMALTSELFKLSRHCSPNWMGFIVKLMR